ncbi:MAG: hypothetical protein ACK4ND_07585 [Cytophagaceae bacterium]
MKPVLYETELNLWGLLGEGRSSQAAIKKMLLYIPVVLTTDPIPFP